MALEHLGTPEAPTFGLDTFGDRGTGPDGSQVTHAEAIRQVLTEGVLADELAVEQMFPHQRDAFTKIGRERGWAPYTREGFDAMTGPTGALFVGSPETVARKIAWAVKTLGLSRFQLKYSVGTQPNADRLASIRLYAEQVVPRVRELLADPEG